MNFWSGGKASDENKSSKLDTIVYLAPTDQYFLCYHVTSPYHDT